MAAAIITNWHHRRFPPFLTRSPFFRSPSLSLSLSLTLPFTRSLPSFPLLSTLNFSSLPFLLNSQTQLAVLSPSSFLGVRTRPRNSQTSIHSPLPPPGKLFFPLPGTGWTTTYLYHKVTTSATNYTPVLLAYFNLEPLLAKTLLLSQFSFLFDFFFFHLWPRLRSKSFP